jgi:hypothetical protein
VIFGGNNPPFIPGSTADMETRYIEIYINNNKEAAQKVDPKILEEELWTSKYLCHGTIHNHYEGDDLLGLV